MFGSSASRRADGVLLAGSVQVRPQPVDQVQVEAGVGGPDVVLEALRGQPPEREQPQRVQQPEPHGVTRARLPDQERGVDEGLQVAGHRLGRADGCDRVGRERGRRDALPRRSNTSCVSAGRSAWLHATRSRSVR